MQVEQFLKIIQSSQEEIDHILGQVEKFYHEKKEFKKDKAGNVRMKNNQPQFRIIRPSTGRLKQIHALIFKKILAKIKMPEYVMGGVKGRSNIQNAARHKGKKFKFQTDLKSFFDTVSNDQVFKMLISRGFGQQVSHLLTKLTTFKGCLPQGASTSQALANLVFLRVDEQLIEICAREKITYTRFVDDLTFSSPNDFQKLTLEFLEIVKANGFVISHKKTSYKSRAEITGVEVDQNSLKVTKSFLKKKSNPANTENQIKGFEVYMNEVEKANSI